MEETAPGPGPGDQVLPRAGASAHSWPWHVSQCPWASLVLAVKQGDFTKSSALVSERIDGNVWYYPPLPPP